MFVWGSTPGLTDLHVLRLPHFADVQVLELNDNMGSQQDGDTNVKYFEDDTANSALFALQLNDPIYNLTIGLTTPSALTSLAALAPSPDEVEKKASRTLKLLNHSVVQSFLAPYEDPSQDEDLLKAPDHDALALGATFERHESYQPAPHVFANLAPHVRAVPTESGTSQVLAPALGAPPEAGNEGGLPATAPKYSCSIYTPLSENILISDGLPSDLVFSILVSNNNNSAYQLIEFDIRILLGGVDPEKNMLMENYDGTGPTMLSNLRFNVLTSFPTIDGLSYLQLRLLPRSSKGWIDITSVREMGFLLALAKVNLFQARETLLNVETFAFYHNDNFSPRKDEFLVSIVNQKVSK